MKKVFKQDYNFINNLYSLNFADTVKAVHENITEHSESDFFFIYIIVLVLIYQASVAFTVTPLVTSFVKPSAASLIALSEK